MSEFVKDQAHRERIEKGEEAPRSSPGSERLALIARADKYLNTGSGEYASEIMREMAEFLRRIGDAAQGAPKPRKMYDSQNGDHYVLDAAGNAYELASPPSPVAGEWQPIQTAPKDQEVEIRGIWKLRGDGVQFTHWRPAVPSTQDQGPRCEHGNPADVCTVCHMWSQVALTDRP